MSDRGIRLLARRAATGDPQAEEGWRRNRNRAGLLGVHSERIRKEISDCVKSYDSRLRVQSAGRFRRLPDAEKTDYLHVDVLLEIRADSGKKVKFKSYDFAIGPRPAYITGEYLGDVKKTLLSSLAEDFGYLVK